jgi:hypothetical protein
MSCIMIMRGGAIAQGDDQAAECLGAVLSVVAPADRACTYDAGEKPIGRQEALAGLRKGFATRSAALLADLRDLQFDIAEDQAVQVR